MKRFALLLLAAFACSPVLAGVPTPMQAPANYSGPNHLPAVAGPNGTTTDTGTGVGTSGNNVCPLNATCTHSGTDNFTGTVKVNGTTQNFPPSGNLLGASDVATLIGKLIDAGQNTIQNLTTGAFASGVIDPDPTLSANSETVVATQAATKAYVDNAAQGLVYKTPVLLETTGNITLSGEQTIDGTLTSSSAVLVNNQTDTTQNGIYTSGSGAWTRRADANTGALLKNAAVLVTSGSASANTTWNCPCAAVTVGTSPVVFVKISGSNVYTGANGVQLQGSQFSVDSTVTRNTATQTLTGKSISGAANTLSAVPTTALTGSLQSSQEPAHTGDMTNSAGSLATTVGKVNGVQYPASPSTNGVPVVTAPNTVAYELVPNSALANPAITIAGQSTPLGGSVNIPCSGLTNAGTACPTNVGVSGATLGLLNANKTDSGNNTYSGTNTHSGLDAFSDITQAQNLLSNRNNPTGPYQVNCGDAVSSEAAPSPGFFVVAAMPQTPGPDCTGMFFNHKGFDFWLDPKGNTTGNYFKTVQFDVVGTPLHLPGMWSHSSFFARYMPGGLSWVFDNYPPPPSSIWRTNLHNGGVRFFHDAVNPQTELCPVADGGLIIHRALFYISTPCVPLPDSVAAAFAGSSQFIYVYAVRENDDLVTGTCGGGQTCNSIASPCPDAGKMCLTITNTVGFYNKTPITCVNFFGTPWTSPTSVGANVVDDPNTILIDSTHVEISDVNYVAQETSYGNKVQPFCGYVGLVPDTAQPVLDPIDEVMANPDGTGKTLVGAEYVDASGAVVSSGCEQNVASFYNQLPAKLQCTLATSTSVSQTTYRTPAVPFYAQFIEFPSPTLGNRSSVATPWSLSMVGNTTTSGVTGAATALFDITLRGASSLCTTSGTPEAPDDQIASLPVSTNVYFKTAGVSSVPTGGRENYMYLCASASAGVLNIKGTADTGTPGATVLSAPLQQ